MKKIYASLLFSTALLAPTLAQADYFVVLGDRIVGFQGWETVIADKDPSDGCGGLGLKEFDPTTTERIKSQGCSIIMIGDLDSVKADKNPKDGCGNVDLNFIMPKARDYILANGCPSMLQDDPWN